MESNRAAWLPHRQARPVEIDDAPMPTPKPNEVIIRVRAVAINPADNAVQTLGVVYNDFPVVIGCDAAGEIVELGANVSGYQRGDRVLASVYSGAFQLYCPVQAPFAAEIPSHIRYTDACVLPLALATAMVHMFESDMLALNTPQAGLPTLNGQTVFIWGGSTAVGSCAIQMAAAAGYEIATAVSEHNFEYCQRLGASHCFDYKNENFNLQVSKVLAGKSMAGAFCAIGSEDVLSRCAQIVDQLGGNKCISTVRPRFLQVNVALPDAVKVVQSQATLHASKVAQELFRNWVPAALEDGTLRPAPYAEVIGRGLEKIQNAMDKLADGVSARKIVVEIP